MNEHLKLLGIKVRDKVTGFIGVASSISFDISGCIQAFVVPSKSKDGKLGDGHWFDTKRLKILDANPVTELPTFEIIPGGQELPGYSSKPRP